MNDDQRGDSIVELPPEAVAALRRNAGASAATASERQRIEATMWAALERESARSSGPLLGDVAADGEQALPARSGRRPIGAIAAAVIVFGVLALVVTVATRSRAPSAPATRPAADATIVPAPHVVELGGLLLHFDVDEEVAIERPDTDTMRLVAVDVVIPGEPVVVARRWDLFGGGSPDEWFDAAGVVATPRSGISGSHRSDAWTLQVVADRAEDAGCEFGDPCVDLAAGLVLRAGYLTDLLLVEAPDGGDPLVVMVAHLGTPDGIINDDGSELRNRFVESLSLTVSGR